MSRTNVSDCSVTKTQTNDKTPDFVCVCACDSVQHLNILCGKVIYDNLNGDFLRKLALDEEHRQTA